MLEVSVLEGTNVMALVTKLLVLWPKLRHTNACAAEKWTKREEITQRFSALGKLGWSSCCAMSDEARSLHMPKNVVELVLAITFVVQQS